MRYEMCTTWKRDRGFKQRRRSTLHEPGLGTTTTIQAHLVVIGSPFLAQCKHLIASFLVNQSVKCLVNLKHIDIHIDIWFWLEILYTQTQAQAN